ncbi:MAG TPA: sensor domain-containing protein [Acidimicrobiia bacterium]|nr:sensor domain-containing protein [Acidimicrobiia bacterium]
MIANMQDAGGGERAAVAVRETGVPATADTARPALWRRILRPYTEARTVKETLYLLLDLPVGIATFTVVVTLVALGFGMLVTLVGIPILIGAAFVIRAMADAERWRARTLLDVRDLTHPTWPGAGEVWWRRCFTVLRDPTIWKETLYELWMLGWGIATFTITVVTWTVPLGLAFLPTYSWASRDGGPPGIGNAWIEAGWSVLGFTLVVAAPWVIRGVATGSRALVRLLLGSRTRDLEARIEHLSDSRARTVDAATAERQRIERALHDGAQMRLTALAMELGRAKERIDTDPEGAAELIGEAHEEAKRALAELRDLARGIHPAVLTDRGLDAAVTALAARSPVPVDVAVELAERPPAAVESTAYYVVAEGLTNVARHSGATRASVVALRVGDRLVVEVHDDGRGGAAIGPADDIVPTGLRGVADRVAGIDGELVVASPEGGPTVLRAAIPWEA